MKDLFTPDDDAAEVRVPPPALFATTALLAWICHNFAIVLSIPVPAIIGQIGGGVVIAVGVTFGVSALSAFSRSGQDPHPWKSTPTVISDGVYGWSRNPMYLAMALVLAGIGLVVDSLWPILWTPVFMGAVFRSAIEPEERYLQKKFGDEYLDYQRRVRRWI